MAAFEFDPNQPIYLQIIAEIKKRFVRGVYAPGAKLPSVRDMAREMRVNPNTMSRAYAELDREGFIFTRRGQGSFVTEKQKTIEGRAAKVGTESGGAVCRRGGRTRAFQIANCNAVAQN